MMARAAKKKIRPETPPLYAVIDNGVIKPAFPYDQERLMSYRKGAKVLVWVDYEGSRPGQRKWYAIINTALKGGNLPWTDLASADISLRLALDMYEPKKTNDGKWHRVPSSLNDYSDKELDEKIELLQALIYQLTGIDPKDFERERAGAGDEQFRTDPPAADNDAGAEASVALPSDASNNSSDDASSPPDDLPASDNLTSTPEPVAGEDSSGASDPVPQVGTAAPGLSAEDRKWLKEGATMMMAAQPAPDPEAKTVLFGQVKGILTLMPKNSSDEARARMEQIKQHCMGVCRGEFDLDWFKVANTALCTVEDITPPPVTTGRKAK
jgi:hypothetical protein